MEGGVNELKRCNIHGQKLPNEFVGKLEMFLEFMCSIRFLLEIKCQIEYISALVL